MWKDFMDNILNFLKRKVPINLSNIKTQKSEQYSGGETERTAMPDILVKRETVGRYKYMMR